MVSTPTALVMAAVVTLGSLWPFPAVGGEAQVIPGESPLCRRIPQEWAPFTYNGMEFYRIPLRAGAQRTAAAKGPWRCQTIPQEWTPFIYKGQKDRKSTRLNSSHLGISYAVF